MQGIIDPSVAPTRATTRRASSWRGLRYYVTYLWSGRASEDMKHKDHVAWVRRMCRMLALPLMFFLGFGALVTLARATLDSTLAIVRTGQFASLDVISLIIIIGIFLLVLGMDGLMIVKSVDTADARAQGTSHADLLGDYLLIAFIAIIETITYSVLLVSTEHPKSREEFALIYMRAAAMPIIAVSLATIHDRIMTDKEMMYRLKVDNANALSSTLNLFKTQVDLKYLPILLAFRRWVTGTDDAKSKQSNEELIQHLDQLMPGAIQAQSHVEIERAKREADDRINAMKRQIGDAFLAIMTGQSLPDWVVIEFPSLANIPTKATRFTAKAASKTSVNASPSDELGDMYERCFGKKPPVNVKKSGATTSEKARGVWIASSDIPALVGGAITDDIAKEIAQKHGQSAKIGTAYGAPLRLVLSDMRIESLLIEPWKSWETTQKSKKKEDESTAIPV